MSELIGSYSIKGRAFLREDKTGRFAAAAAAGGRAAVGELVETLVSLIRASISAQTKVRTGELLGSVHGAVLSEQEGQVVSDSDHVAPLDRGARRHFIPNAFGMAGGVWHPGNKPPMRFFEQSAEALAALGPEIIRRHMP